MKCPLCGKDLIRQSSQDAGGYEPDLYCPEEVKEVGDTKSFNHYRIDYNMDLLTMYVLPFRIVNSISNPSSGTKIGIHSKYKKSKFKNRKFYFKTILKCPTVHPDREDKLRDRIKLLLIMS